MSSTFSYSPETYVMIGEVIKAQGLRGELKIHCYSGQPENLKDYQCLVLVGKKGEVSPELPIQSSRKQGGSAIVLLKTISDRNTAEQCVGCGVLIARRDLPAPQNEEFYWLDIQGKKVRTTDDRELGEVTHLFSNGAQDVMVISDGQNEYMVPVVAGIVLSVTGEAILIEPPTGLLEINVSRAD